MEFRRPPIDKISDVAAHEDWVRVLQHVEQRAAHIIIEKDGTELAALISPEDFKWFRRMLARREEKFKFIDEMREAFKDVPEEELEREVARAIAEVRAENRARVGFSTGSP